VRRLHDAKHRSFLLATLWWNGCATGFGGGQSNRSVTLLHARDGEVRGLLRVSARPAWQRLQTLTGRAAQRGRAAAWRVGAACAATLRAQLTRRLSRWPLAWRHIPRPTPSGPPRVIYYLRVFPILSETFIQREIAALLELGMSLEVLAEEARGTEHFDDDAHRMAARTTYLGPPPASSSALWFWLLRRPLMLLNTIAYVRLRTHTVRKSALGDRAITRRALRLARLLRQYRATHIHAPWSGSGALAALLAAHLAGIRYSVQARIRLAQIRDAARSRRSTRPRGLRHHQRALQRAGHPSVAAGNRRPGRARDLRRRRLSPPRPHGCRAAQRRTDDPVGGPAGGAERDRRAPARMSDPKDTGTGSTAVTSAAATTRSTLRAR
jgi:hypothetical protein